MEDCLTDSELLTQFHKKSPQLRFSGFKKIENEKLKDENWFSAPASEIFISVNDRNHPELPVLSASQELGMIYRDEGGMNIFHDVANEITYKRVKPGQFVIHLRSFQGGFAHSKIEGITSPAYTILDFKDKNKHNDLFWKYVLTSEEFIKRLELITYGIRDGRSINFSDFSTLNFYFPSYEVQQKIGAFLSHVDSLIQAKTKKLESLKAVKKSLLQKCFPKAGQKVPEMRFAGFSGDWEEKEFIELVSRESKTKISDENNPCVEYEDITPEIGILNNDVYKKKVRKTGISFDNKNILYGKLRPYLHNWLKPNFEGVAVGDWWVLEPNNVDRDFLYRLIQTNKFDDIANQSSGSKMPRADWNLISHSTFSVPMNIEEQQKIGQFFLKYDSFISAQQKEIDKLKDIKKSLLQKMFI